MASVKANVLLSAALLAGTASVVRAHVIPYFAVMDAQQVVDPTDSLATGACSIGYDHHGFSMEVKLYLEGISLEDLSADGPNGTSIHIHKAVFGENGPLVIDLGWWFPTTLEEYEPNRIFAHWQGVFIGGEQGNVWSDFVDNQFALYDGHLYVDVHTTAYPNGEIRGQILEVPAPGAMAMMGVAASVATRRRRTN